MLVSTAPKSSLLTLGNILISILCVMYYVLCLKSVTTLRVALQSDLWVRSDIGHRELHALLFATSVWVLLRPTGLCEQ